MEQNREKCLRENLLPSKKAEIGTEVHLSAWQPPKHTAKATLEWLRNKNINVMEWSSQSCDLNLIENLWHDFKIAVHQRSPLNFTELEQFCTEEWVNIAQLRCAKLIETDVYKITAVISVEGASTKY